MSDEASAAFPLPVLPRISGMLTMFYYQDLEAAAHWYEHIIGFKRVLEFEGLALFHVAKGAKLALVGAGYGSQRPIEGENKGTIISIETDDLANWHERLFRLEVPGTGSGVQVGADGRSIEFKVKDPGGYTVEFFEWID